MPMSLTLNAFKYRSEPFGASVPQDGVGRFSAEMNPYLFPLSAADGIPAGFKKTPTCNSPPSEVWDDGERHSSWWLVQTKPRQKKTRPRSSLAPNRPFSACDLLCVVARSSPSDLGSATCRLFVLLRRSRVTTQPPEDQSCCCNSSRVG